MNNSFSLIHFPLIHFTMEKINEASTNNFLIRNNTFESKACQIKFKKNKTYKIAKK